MKDKSFENILDELKKETFKDGVILNEADNFEENKQNDTPVIDYNFSIKSKESDHYNAKFNVIWSENKETLLFSLLSSIIVIITGIISSYEYIVFLGAVSFMLFSVLVFISFFRYILVAYHKSKIPEDVYSRISAVEKKVDFLSKKDSVSGSGIKNKDLEEEVAEIKSVLKTLISSLKK